RGTYATRCGERSAAWRLSARGQATGRRRARPRAPQRRWQLGRATCLIHNQLLGLPDGLLLGTWRRGTRGILDAVRHLDLKRIGAGSLAGLWKRTAGWCAFSVIAASRLMASMKGSPIVAWRDASRRAQQRMVPREAAMDPQL